MSRKIGLHIGGRRFDVDAEDGFAVFLEKQMLDDFDMDGNNDIKSIFLAYVRKNHKIYAQERKIDEIIKKLG